MNYEVFFNRLRGHGALGVTKFTQVQVDVAQMLIAKSHGLRADALAYILATAWGEAKFTPQRENMSYSAARIREVWPSRFPTVADAKPYERQPVKLANKVYNGRLGNREGSNDGWDFRGGGLDQLTGRVNYRKRNIEQDPDAILKPEVAARSIIAGMTLGDYRGPKLSDYFNDRGANFAEARAIINDDVKANGQRYARYALAFLNALIAAGYAPNASSAPATAPNASSAPATPAKDRKVSTGTIQPLVIGVGLAVLTVAYFLLKG